jgi:hypothetical protein
VKPGKDWVAVIIAVGICTAMNTFTFAVLYDAIFSKGSGLSENATQVLTGWGGGLIGILGAYVGYRAGRAQTTGTPPDGYDSTNGEEPP